LAIRFAKSPTMRAGHGLVLAALAQLLSAFLAGAGHGWVSPFFMSSALWALLPITLVVVRPPEQGSRLALFGIAAIALGADALLITWTIGEGNALPFYIQVAGAAGLVMIVLWLVLWLFWQVMLIQALVAGRRRSDDANA
jgi:hypothetical protein